ncbi:hypothetical protein [Aquimarina sp. AU474]|uniref:hypothetical protein n=1 Tax=Aquimarina sp. AU474 TaxID=2108529 RepID=UPI000D69D5F7|nr:hypothetical protein [Aquimarina sp. AU474]
MKKMKFYIVILLWTPVYLFGQFSPEKLIDFDTRSSQKYIRKHRVITALLDQSFNFGSIANSNDNTIWINEIKANFTTLYDGKKDQLSVANESLMHNWLKEHRSDRIYFSVNESAGGIRLIGYSKKGIKPKIRKQLIDKENIELIDFTNVDISTLDPTNYAVGWLETNSSFPLFFKDNITLIYPTNLTLNPETFMKTYSLSKKISVRMAEILLQNNRDMGFDSPKLVLKKVGDRYEIVGFTKKKR